MLVQPTAFGCQLLSVRDDNGAGSPLVEGRRDGRAVALGVSFHSITLVMVALYYRLPLALPTSRLLHLHDVSCSVALCGSCHSFRIVMLRNSSSC